MICIYHSRDLDGYCSGAIVKKKYPEAVLIGYDYGQPFPFEKIGKDEHVIMIDVSLPMSEMLELSRLVNGNFLWIDHHISAIKEYQECLKNREGMEFMKTSLQDGIAACEIGWKTLFPDEEMPPAVKLLGEYDTWRKQDKRKWEYIVLPFQYGMRQFVSSAETFPMELLDDADETSGMVKKIIDGGTLILDYQSTQNEIVCKKAFDFEFEGLRAICLNNTLFNSNVFKSVYNPEKHDIMIPFTYDGIQKRWIFSIYTDKDNIDCSAMAKARGGGGHKQAAGFQADDIRSVFPFM
jgi:oligoribonuclease NrnB/cAMP/cGMP phosphodiesterase (DHH superfamily)